MEEKAATGLNVIYPCIFGIRNSAFQLFSVDMGIPTSEGCFCRFLPILEIHRNSQAYQHYMMCFDLILSALAEKNRRLIFLDNVKECWPTDVPDCRCRAVCPNRPTQENRAV